MLRLHKLWKRHKGEKIKGALKAEIILEKTATLPEVALINMTARLFMEALADMKLIHLVKEIKIATIPIEQAEAEIIKSKLDERKN